MRHCQVAAQELLSARHCGEARERYEREMKAGTWKPTGVPTNYEGIPLHIASSVVDRLTYLKKMKE